MHSMYIPYGIYTVKAKVSPFTVLIFVIYTMFQDILNIKAVIHFPFYNAKI